MTGKIEAVKICGFEVYFLGHYIFRARVKINIKIVCIKISQKSFFNSNMQIDVL